MMHFTDEEAYERKLINELTHEKFSWNTVLNAIRLVALLHN